MAIVGSMKIEKTMPSKLFHLLCLQVDDIKSEKLTRYHFKEDALRSLMGELLVRYMLETHFSLSRNAIRFQTNSFGKPELMDVKNLHFNLAHSGNWVVVAIDKNPIGIDIEEMKSIDIDVMKEVLTTQEIKSLQALPANEQPSFFYDLWTLKESYVKYKGKGFTIPPSSISVDVSTGNFIKLFDINSKQLPCFFQQLKIDAAYKMALCTYQNSTVTYLPFTQQAIMNHFLAVPS